MVPEVKMIMCVPSGPVAEAIADESLARGTHAARAKAVSAAACSRWSFRAAVKGARREALCRSRKNSAVTEASRTTSWGGGCGVIDLRRIAWKNCGAAHGDGRRRGDHVVEHVERGEREQVGAERFEAVGEVSARGCALGGLGRRNHHRPRGSPLLREASKVEL